MVMEVLLLLRLVIQLMMAVGTAPTDTTVLMMMIVMIVMQIVRIFHHSFGCLCEDFVTHERFGMQH